MASSSTKGISPTTGTAYEVTEEHPTDSAEISIGANGKVTVSVKSYAKDADEAAANALATFKDVVENLKKSGYQVSEPKA